MASTILFQSRRGKKMERCSDSNQSKEIHFTVSNWIQEYSLINSVRRKEHGAEQRRDVAALLPALPWTTLLLGPSRSLVDAPWKILMGASVQPYVLHRDCVTLEHPCASSHHRCPVCSKPAWGCSDQAEKLQHGWATCELGGDGALGPKKPAVSPGRLVWCMLPPNPPVPALWFRSCQCCRACYQISS